MPHSSELLTIHNVFNDRFEFHISQWKLKNTKKPWLKFYVRFLVRHLIPCSSIYGELKRNIKQNKKRPSPKNQQGIQWAKCQHKINEYRIEKSKWIKPNSKAKAKAKAKRYQRSQIKWQWRETIDHTMCLVKMSNDRKRLKRKKLCALLV